MATVRFEGRSGKEFAQFQSEVSQAVAASSAAAMMNCAWQDHTLHIQAPGAQGFVRLVGSRLLAEIRLSFPAILMKQKIVQDIERVLSRVADAPVATLEQD